MNPQFLFDAWRAVAGRLREASRLALLLDFDGTLTPIARRGRATLEDERRHLLKRIAALRRVNVWIVSGRRTEDIRTRIAVPGVKVLGVYGWQVPASRKRAMQRLYRSTERRLRGVPGVWLEDKAACFAVHHRHAADAIRRRARRMLREEMPDGVEILRSKGAWEIAPRGFRGKGSTVSRLLAAQPPGTLPVFAGDDSLDEPAFAALPDAVTVRVGPARKTAARYYVRSPREMWEFLRRIEAIRS